MEYGLASLSSLTPSFSSQAITSSGTVTEEHLSEDRKTIKRELKVRKETNNGHLAQRKRYLRAWHGMAHTCSWQHPTLEGFPFTTPTTPHYERQSLIEESFV